MSNKNLENVLLQENVDFEIEQAAVDAQNAAQKEENLENLENNENAQNEESGESGEGLEDYYPYAGVDFKSVRTHRNLAMEQWFGVDENNVLQMANQDDDDDDHHDAVRLPILARFIQKCPRRTKEELERKEDVYVVLVAIDEEDEKSSSKSSSKKSDKNTNFYVIYYGGVRFMEHSANIGSDFQMYPYSSLSAAGKALYGNNVNGWMAFEISDPELYDKETGLVVKGAGPHHGKKLGKLRKADGGPGFVNTFSPEKIAEWKNYGKTKLTDQANHHFNILCDEIQKINALKSMTTSSTNNSDNDGGEADHDDEDDNDVAKKVTKSVGRSVKGSMVQKAKAIRAKKVDKPKVDTSLNSLMGNKVGKKQPMKQPKRAPRTTGLKTIAAGKRPTSAKNVARKHLHGKSKQDDELDSSDDSNGSNGSNESEERDSDMPVQNAFVKEGKTLINVKTGARKSFAVSSKGAKEASKDEQEPLQKVVRKVVINMPKGPKTHSGHAGPAEVEKSVANATNVTNATNLTLPFIDFGHTKESFEELPESDKSRLLVIMNHIQNLKRERDGADVAVKGNNGGNNGGAKKRVKVDDEQQA